MIIVVVSDLHGDKDTLGISRAAEVTTAMEEAVEYAIEVEADAFVCLGDIADPDSGAAFRAIEMCIEQAHVLAQHEIMNVWIAGNHDVWEDGSGATCLSPLAAIERRRGANELIYVAEQPRVIGLNDGVHSLFCLPFTPVSHNYDPREAARKAFEANPDRKIVTVGHLMIKGVVPGEETIELPRGRDVAFPVDETKSSVIRLNGHYHTRQTTAEGIIIPGSLCRFTFSDDKLEPGYLHITL